ncbi:hypothetical protein CEK25_010287 [Fusarium fujikuroi]|nr:hypothetical protein CEK25_010287 [Fusarium fujikuroi]
MGLLVPMPQSSSTISPLEHRVPNRAQISFSRPRDPRSFNLQIRFYRLDYNETVEPSFLHSRAWTTIRQILVCTAFEKRLLPRHVRSSRTISFDERVPLQQDYWMREESDNRYAIVPSFRTSLLAKRFPMTTTCYGGVSQHQNPLYAKRCAVTNTICFHMGTSDPREEQQLVLAKMAGLYGGGSHTIDAHIPPQGRPLRGFEANSVFALHIPKQSEAKCGGKQQNMFVHVLDEGSREFHCPISAWPVETLVEGSREFLFARFVVIFSFSPSFHLASDEDLLSETQSVDDDAEELES